MRKQFKTLSTGLDDDDLASTILGNLTLATQSDKFIVLAAEWSEICEKLTVSHEVEFDARRDLQERPVFIVSSPLGYHESSNSFENAYERLVDSHRTRVEDLSSTHEAMRQVLGITEDGNHYQLKRARNECASLAETIRAMNPDMPGHLRDALVLSAIESLRR